MVLWKLKLILFNYLILYSFPQDSPSHMSWWDIHGLLLTPTVFIAGALLSEHSLIGPPSELARGIVAEVTM